MPATGAVRLNEVAPSTHEGDSSAVPSGRNTETRMIGTLTALRFSTSDWPAVAVNVTAPPWPGAVIVAVNPGPPCVIDPAASGGTS